MPQFDFNSFSGQTFWTLTFFVIFYFVGLYFYIPFLSEGIKLRKKLTSLFLSFIKSKTISHDKSQNLFKIYCNFIF